MEREEAVCRLQKLIGQDLRPLADTYGVTVWKEVIRPDTKEMVRVKNKGWAGQVLQYYLGMPLDSSREPDFGTWELKQCSLKNSKRKGICVKETMAICMLDQRHVVDTDFESSHLFSKLRKAVVAARVFESVEDTRSLLYSVGMFDLDDKRIYAQVRADYELVRNTLRGDGYEALSGKMGVLIQPRTKGPGNGSTSRAFYARTKFVAHILGLKACKV